jgi:hypothetical protein
VNVVAAKNVRALEISAKVVRCGCSDEQKQAPGWHGKRGEACPRPRAVEDRGVLVRWHRNPLRQAWNAVRRAFGKV